MKNAPSPYWVLVADSGCARLFELSKDPARFRELEKLVSASQHKTSKELVSDGSGRIANVAGGPSSHTMQPRSDAHELAEQAFSNGLVDKLEQAANGKAFQHLVVVADPKTLGRLRQHMSKALAATVKHELNRDLVALPIDALEKRVRAELGWAD
jgi:protein required for attachment to host cells